jgi:hypothetical protein
MNINDKGENTMKPTIKEIFLPLTQRSVRWVVLGVILAMAAFSLFVLHLNINGYKQYLDTVKQHQKIDVSSTLHAEKLNAILEGRVFENFNFSILGINTFVIPPAVTIFDLNTRFGTITRGNIQAGGPIRIDDVIINIFSLDRMSIVNTFSGFLLIMAGIFFLMFGFALFYYAENTAFFQTENYKSLFVSRVIASFLTVLLLDGLFMAMALIYCHYQGLSIPIDSSILHIYFLFIIAHWLLFSLGALISAFWPISDDLSWKGAAVVFFIIALIGSAVFYVQRVSDKEQDKLEQVVFKGNVEQINLFFKMYGQLYDLGEKFGRGDIKNKQVQDIVLNYLDIDYNKIEALENRMIEAQKDLYTTTHRYSKFFPLAYIWQTFYELGGTGGQNTFNFNQYLRDKNRRYLKAIIDNVYFSVDKAEKKYYKDDEPFYYSKSYIPTTFYQALVIFFCYSLILITITYFILGKLVIEEVARIKKREEIEKENRRLEKEWWELSKGRVLN